LTRENTCSTLSDQHEKHDQERRDQVDTVTMLANLRVYTPMLSINNDGEWRLEILTTTPHVFEGELDVVIRQAYETADTLEAV
jgi:hypothetical protein